MPDAVTPAESRARKDRAESARLDHFADGAFAVAPGGGESSIA